MIPFAKYSGCGNDFILIDSRNGAFSPSAEPIQKLCHRSLGIGADGVILLDDSKNADFKMRIFNTDGSEAEMCGNGLRCLGKYLHDQGLIVEQCCIEVWGKQYSLKVSGGTVTVSMPPPSVMIWDQTLTVDGKIFHYDFLDTGVPHAVIYLEDLSNFNISKLGSAIRYHSQFSPNGTNVDFACMEEDGIIRIRTYERGVEGETLGCGTGATATAISASKRFNLSTPITIMTKSGDPISFNFRWEGSKVTDLTMTGPALFHFRGEAKCFLELNSRD